MANQDHVSALQKLFGEWGTFKSTADVPREDSFKANQFYQYSEKSLCALAAASMYAGGDYMEFGSTDMHTFRNFLTSADIFRFAEIHPNIEYWAFDFFGNVDMGNAETNEKIAATPGYQKYLDHFKGRGDLYEKNVQMMRDHGLFVDQCHLVKGYFEETLTVERAREYLARGRSVGFACLDCNIGPPYKLVFEFLFELMQPTSYIYLDEYYSATVIRYFDEWCAALRRNRGIGCRFIRAAGGFGALFYLFPIDESSPPLELGRLDRAP